MNLHEIFYGKATFHLALILASAAFVCIFSTSTSPLYSSLGDDSAIFQAVGKGWAEGRLPYVELFENKGALLFLIDALGYAIAPRVGIMLLQIPAMYLSMLLAWRTLSLYLSGRARLAAALFMIIFDAVYYLDGNRTEEWSMPFLMAAIYFFLRGLKDNKFSPRYGFVCGVGFGACVLLRTTNALPICCCLFLSAILLIRSGEVKNLLRNAVNFCVGFVMSVLPFVIYFAAHGALYDMLYGTILLNASYSAQRSSFLMTHLDEYAAHVVIHFMPLYLMIVACVAGLVLNKSRVAMSGLFCSVTMLIMLFKSSPYLGYYALITPLLPMFFAVLSEFAGRFRALFAAGNFVKRVTCKLLVAIVLLYPLILAQELIRGVVFDNSTLMRRYAVEQNAAMQRLAELIPSEERGSVMIWSEGTHASHWILVTGIYPRCRFFSNIKAFANVDPNVKREWLEDARNAPPQWIIYCAHVNEFFGEYPDAWTRHFRQNRDLDVERLLHERYTLEDEMEAYQDFFRLYRLKEPLDEK